MTLVSSLRVIRGGEGIIFLKFEVFLKKYLKNTFLNFFKNEDFKNCRFTMLC